MDDDFVKLSIADNEKSLNLTAPNGEKIANNILHLKEIVSVYVSERFGIDKDFNITNLEYYPVPDGYAALIKYRTSDDIEGGLIQTNSNSLTLMSDKIRFTNTNVRLKTSGEAVFSINGHKTVVTCSPPPNSSCSCIPEIISEGNYVTIMCTKLPSTCEIYCTMTVGDA
jgi:hypothetical protein